MNDIEIIVRAERDLYTDEEWADLLDDTMTITRCEHCVHYESRDEMYGVCKLLEHMWHFVSADDFCSRGERR